MKTVLVIAGNEVRTALRNRWIAAVIILFAGLSLLLASLGSAPVGTVKGGALAIVVASLASLSVYLVPLIALMLSHDAIVGEAERGTLLLFLTYPITRWQLLAGKFLGHLAILALALVIGFGLAGIVMSAQNGVDADGIGALLRLISSSVLLGAAFIAFGYLISVLARERATAVGAAIGVWLVMVIFYDLALVGLLIADTGQTIGRSVVAAAMSVNPADAFRVYNLSLLDGASGISGIGAAAAGVAPVLMLLSIGTWGGVAAAFAYVRFRRYEP